MLIHPRVCSLLALALALALGCTAQTAVPPETNPFIDEPTVARKADTSYVNPDGIEVEVDLEADVEADGFGIEGAPALLGQYALTYLRERKLFYLESLAEDVSSRGRVEWLVDGSWVTATDASGLDPSKLTHFRIRAMNAVLLLDAADGVEQGTVFHATVPRRPYEVYSAAGDTCANHDSHLGVSASIYWYVWNPDREGCAIPTQEMAVTVSKMFPVKPVAYPEYDRLLADNKLTAVVLFGQIDDEPGENETGARNFRRMALSLARAGYQESASAPVGKRFSRRIGDVDFEIDLYAPSDFSGLSDYAHFDNFQRAISEHEILAYDGHSMLGASDFWARPAYPNNYQIFLYGGCLGYEYYVRPILQGKGGWENVDILSSVIEVSADANQYAAPVLAKIAFGLEHGTLPSWNDLLAIVRERVGDSTFGVSGARDNCYTPEGSRCDNEATTTGGEI